MVHGPVTPIEKHIVQEQDKPKTDKNPWPTKFVYIKIQKGKALVLKIQQCNINQSENKKRAYRKAKVIFEMIEIRTNVFLNSDGFEFAFPNHPKDKKKWGNEGCVIDQIFENQMEILRQKGG